MMLPTPNTFDGQKPKRKIARWHHRYSSRMGSDSNLREIVAYDWNIYRINIIDEYTRIRKPPASLTPIIDYHGKSFLCSKPIPWEEVNGEELLSSEFTEWIMGLPAGWVTEKSLNLSRSQIFKLLGNGVAPPQAELALNSMRASIPKEFFSDQASSGSTDTTRP